MSYCTALESMKEGERVVHEKYHGTQYGFPISDDDEFFCRLALEINQAGLSWTTILKKEQNFRSAFAGFSIECVAEFSHTDTARLLADAGIVRNRLKVHAVIENARRIQTLQNECGSFLAWLEAHHPMEQGEWTRLFKKTFLFTGGEIVREFLVSTGYLSGSHDVSCPIYTKVCSANPAWMRV
jgi:DNA-3-methyladenine glycosylase I